MKIRIYRNHVPGAPRLKRSRFYGQTLIWLGPVFILIQKGS